MALAANYGKEFPESLLSIWLDLLKDYSVKAVNAGVRKVISDYEYKTIPPFAVLRKAMDKASGLVSPERALDMSADAEWNKLLDDISRYGRYKRPALHATTAYVLRGMGGWDAACNWETDKLEWRRKEFIEAWKLAHGNVDALSLGAGGVDALTSDGFEPAGAIMGRVLGLSETSQAKAS